MSSEEDEAGHHENRVQIELQVRILRPGESAAVLEAPGDDEGDAAEEEHLCQQSEQGEAAARAARHLHLLLVDLPLEPAAGTERGGGGQRGSEEYSKVSNLPVGLSVGTENRVRGSEEVSDVLVCQSV